ncbi:MAG: hypothetical protein J5449_01965 [Oscillospiraceae bacterium]|nr:hypothetical protein [Oscillospiraceae bacterium]
MQTNTLQKSVSQGSKKAQQQTEKERRRAVRQTVRGGGSKAVYTALNTTQKAQFARELEEYYRRSQNDSGDHLSKQTAARKSKVGAGSSTHISSSGRTLGGSSGSFDEPSPYALRRQQKDEARQTIRERWLDYLGTAAVQSQRAAAGYYSPPSEQLSLARRQADNAQAIREARARFDEANRTIDWDGRSELTSALEELDRQSGWEINEEQANEIERERQMLLARLRAGDYRAGNGIRSGTDADTGRDVVGSAAEGIAGAGVNLFSNFGKNLERIDAYFPKPLDTISDLINGQEWGATRQKRIAAYEDPASQEKWKRIDAIADQLDYGAAQLLQRAKEGKSLAGEFGVDVAKNALEMSFDAGVAFATGGSALVPMGVRVYGQSVGTARRAGATLEQQTAYALTNTAIEVASERLFNGVAGIYGAGAADEITEELVRRLADTDAGRTLLRSVIGAAGEGTEEVVSDLLSPLAEATYRNESVAELYRQLDPADVLYSYMIGVAMGTFGAGADIATGQNAEANAELRARDADVDAYLRRMEEIGYLPPESNENAAREGAAEESTAVNTDPAKHTAVEQAVIDEYQAAVDETLKEFIQQYISSSRSYFKRKNLTRVSDRQAADAARLLGGDYSGYQNAINTNCVRHIIKEHGSDGTVDHSMSDINDLSRLSFVLSSYDSVERAVYASEEPKTSKEFRNADDSPAPMLLYQKKVNGTYYIVEAVPDSGKSNPCFFSRIEADVTERASSQTATDPSLVSASVYRIAEPAGGSQSARGEGHKKRVVGLTHRRYRRHPICTPI